jgi:uncharacterized RDD family membrane protein YckC
MAELAVSDAPGAAVAGNGIMRLPPTDLERLNDQEPEPILKLLYAGLSRRLLAFALDLVFGLVAVVLVMGAFGFLIGVVSFDFEEVSVIESWRANPAAGIWLFVIFTYVLYFVVPEARSGATLGKRLLRLRVATESGHPIDWTASVIRNLIRPIDALGGFVFALGARRQRLGDRAANTVVLRS